MVWRGPGRLRRWRGPAWPRCPLVAPSVVLGTMPPGGVACGRAAALRAYSSGALFLMVEFDSARRSSIRQGGPWIRRPASRLEKHSAALRATAGRAASRTPAASALIPQELSPMGRRASDGCMQFLISHFLHYCSTVIASFFVRATNSALSF